MATSEEWQRGYNEGQTWGEVRGRDPGIDLRWVLVGETGEFIRGFSRGLADYERTPGIAAED